MADGALPSTVLLLIEEVGRNSIVCSGIDVSLSFKLEFPYYNKETEYEALIWG